jgi:hypothetical protein
VEIIRPSEHQLILNTSGNMRKVIQQLATIAPYWIAVEFLFLLMTKANLGIIPFISFPYVGICFISMVITHDNTAIFDLDLQTIRIERYWILFRKRQCYNYDLVNIKNIIVEEDDDIDRYFIKLQQHSGEDIQVSYSDFIDREIVDINAQQIRDFLSLNSTR